MSVGPGIDEPMQIKTKLIYAGSPTWKVDDKVVIQTWTTTNIILSYLTLFSRIPFLRQNRRETPERLSDRVVLWQGLTAAIARWS